MVATPKTMEWLTNVSVNCIMEVVKNQEYFVRNIFGLEIIG